MAKVKGAKRASGLKPQNTHDDELEKMYRKLRPLRPWDVLTDITGAFVMTGFVSGVLSQSLMLVGAPGVGKSTIVKRFQNAPNTFMVFDITMQGLTEHVLPKLRENDSTHLIIPEYNKLSQRRGETADNLDGWIQGLMTGELERSYVGPKKIDEYADMQLGVLTAMPTTIFDAKHKLLAQSGFLDRTSVLNVQFPKSEMQRIDDAIMRGDDTDTYPVNWTFPEQRYPVRWSSQAVQKRFQKAIDLFQNKVGARQRLVKRMRAIVMAIALRDGQEVVRVRHVEQLMTYVPLLRESLLIQES